MAGAVVVIANDFTALSVALPAIEKDFHSEIGTGQWAVNAYALIFGVLIVTGGRLADMFGAGGELGRAPRFPEPANGASLVG